MKGSPDLQPTGKHRLGREAMSEVCSVQNRKLVWCNLEVVHVPGVSKAIRLRGGGEELT